MTATRLFRYSAVQKTHMLQSSRSMAAIGYALVNQGSAALPGRCCSSPRMLQQGACELGGGLHLLACLSMPFSKSYELCLAPVPGALEMLPGGRVHMRHVLVPHRCNLSLEVPGALRTRQKIRDRWFPYLVYRRLSEISGTVQFDREGTCIPCATGVEFRS